jgi:hypothetical protein
VLILCCISFDCAEIKVGKSIDKNPNVFKKILAKAEVWVTLKGTLLSSDFTVTLTLKALKQVEK